MYEKLVLGLFIGAALFNSCTPDIPVEWHEPNAKWKGVVEGGIAIPGGPVTVRCCDPGDNCANRGIQSSPIPVQLRTYIDQDNLKGYFENENWSEELPELAGQRSIVNYIISNNPKAQLLANYEGKYDFVIYKDRNSPLVGDANVLFVITNRTGTFAVCYWMMGECNIIQNDPNNNQAQYNYCVAAVTACLASAFIASNTCFNWQLF